MVTSVKQNLIYIVLDVDDTQCNDSTWDKDTAEVIGFNCCQGVLA